MGVEEEAVVREFLAELEGPKWDADQIERILDHMTRDIHYHVYAWERPVVGQDAVREELLAQAPLFRDLRLELKAVASTGHTVLLERFDSMAVGKKPLMLHVAAVFEVDEAGKFAAWREYYDSKEIATQLGADVAAAGSRA